MNAWSSERPDDAVVALGMTVIGAGVRAGRLRLGLTQERLGRLVGVSQSAISRLETGTIQGLRFRTLAKLVGVLEAAPGTFTFPVGQIEPPSLTRAQRHRLRSRYGW